MSGVSAGQVGRRAAGGGRGGGQGGGHRGRGKRRRPPGAGSASLRRRAPSAERRRGPTAGNLQASASNSSRSAARARVRASILRMVSSAQSTRSARPSCVNPGPCGALSASGQMSWSSASRCSLFIIASKLGHVTTSARCRAVDRLTMY